ncbi:MAG: hypothetical protein Q4P66_00160, partial [Actinomycetaceae bacterium]|nr:hypothetical protein [Actinomycetaceae bacterium]
VNIKFMTAPYTGTGMAGDQSVVWLDEPALADLSKAWVDDRVGEWVENHPDSVRTLDKGPIH